MKAATALVLVAVLILPGCFVFDLAFNIIGTAFNILESALGALFFWAAPAPPEAAPALAGAEPLPLSEALAIAEVLHAEGTPVLVPPGSVATFDGGPPPRPGAVLYAIPVVAD